MKKDESVIQALAVANALIGEKAFSEALDSFLNELIDDEVKPIPAVPIDENYREDEEEE